MAISCLRLLALTLTIQGTTCFSPMQISTGTAKMRYSSELVGMAAKKRSGKSNDRGKSGGGGFGRSSDDIDDSDDKPQTFIEKTYGASAIMPMSDIIDVESAMKDFFDSNEDWHPLFRSIASSSSVPAMDMLVGAGVAEPLLYGEEHGPWKKLDAKPKGDDEINVVSLFLDSSQKSLLDIPVMNVKDDEHDLQFIEEGRRMLAIQRFHVLPGVSSGSVHHHEELFATCWSEVAELRQADEPDTGSIVLLPDYYSLDDLRRFTDMYLQRPLSWLGVDSFFEVATLQRDTMAIRFLHKLTDIPELPPQQEQ
uniref:Uncharacterized protein n=1 Tax=Ditylum brightwellii TaxID=49249 RepID=A0A6V2APG9_9STRA